MKRIAIVGGGAAGLAAAVAAGERLREVAACCEVVIYEADERVGRSILATGNGRCNFSNTRVDEGDYRNAGFVTQALEALGALAATEGAAPVAPAEIESLETLQSQCAECCDEGAVASEGAVAPEVTLATEGAAIPESMATPEDPVRRFFASLGLLWREEDDGRCYPATNKASTVLDVLRAAAAASGVREECGCGVVGIDAPAKAGARFTLRMADGAFVRADAVILACGGRAGLGVAAGGHAAADLVPEGFDFQEERLRPVLGPLKTDTHAIKGLDGVRVRCAAKLLRAGKLIASERGEVLFRAYGVSGIAVFDLSRHALAGDELVLDLLPDVRECDVHTFANARYALMAGQGIARTCEDFLRGLVLPLVGRAVLAQAGIKRDAPCSQDALAQLVLALKRFSMDVHGVADARQCQVARGGLGVDAFCPQTMESRALPGFFAVGEALDTDARCGGFNLHWAWSSGILAGIEAVGRVAFGKGGRA